MAFVHDFDEERNIATIEVKNIFSRYDELEVFGPAVDNAHFRADDIYDENWQIVDLCNKPTQILYVRVPFRVHRCDMIRKVNH